jgi:2-polyprenyl-3-methyl-5-hydroxy-6-metoxy-1,4-benzoquinol methylase
MTGNKTIKKYWDGIWQQETITKPIDPHFPGIKNYIVRMYHSFFIQSFLSLDTKHSKLLEIGCANSSWLPYFHKEFDFNVSGLDYSEIGCNNAIMNLNNEGVVGEIFCADLYTPPLQMLECYDVVISFGVVEHFEDTYKCLEALSIFLKSGGLLITSIPNMSGFLGLVQKHVNRPIFDIHNPLDRDEFHSAHEIAGYNVVECKYFISTNFGVCNLNGIPRKKISWRIKKTALAVLTRVSMLVWMIESKLGRLPTSRLFSPHIICIARKQ